MENSKQISMHLRECSCQHRHEMRRSNEAMQSSALAWTAAQQSSNAVISLARPVAQQSSNTVVQPWQLHCASSFAPRLATSLLDCCTAVHAKLPTVFLDCQFSFQPGKNSSKAIEHAVASLGVDGRTFEGLRRVPRLEPRDKPSTWCLRRRTREAFNSLQVWNTKDAIQNVL